MGNISRLEIVLEEGKYVSGTDLYSGHWLLGGKTRRSVTTMSEELLYEKGGVLVRRAILEPGESSAWHTDACDRVTVILSGDRLGIEFRDSGEIHESDVRAGQVDWDEPTSEVHRAINVGRCRYEEVVTFFLSEPGQDPQPKAK